VGLLRVKPEVEKRQKDRTVQVREDRDNGRVKQALKRLEDVALGKDNTMPACLECVEAYATLGEICDVLRSVFGSQKEFLVF
jgi:methylmalonyl-CoA mutase N-terminal domain/subunit